MWDVRSSKPLKTFHTDTSRVSLGQGGATGWLSDDPWDWTRGSCKAPGWSVRNVKFSHSNRSGMGKETMVFTEVSVECLRGVRWPHVIIYKHTSLIHVVDARTFETEEIIQAPCAPAPSTAGTLPATSPTRTRGARRRTHPMLSQSGIATPPTMSYDQPSAHSPRMFMAALEDTFRIPSMSPSARRRRSRRSTPTPSGITVHEEDLVVIPPLGDREVENDVQALLSRHGIRTRQASGNDRDRIDLYTTRNSDDDMEVDELESDCLSSHAPSRSSSPSPSVNIGGTGSRYSFSPPARTIARAAPNHEAGEDALDIAGMCFDPSGGWIYVATTESVAEWSVKGAEKTWWVGNDWA